MAHRSIPIDWNWRNDLKSTSFSHTHIIANRRHKMGAEKFDALWREEIGQPIPEWLTQTDEKEEEQGMTPEQFIARAIQSAMEKCPEAEVIQVRAEDGGGFECPCGDARVGEGVATNHDRR